MENKNKVLLTVLSVATLLVALVGATFAYFSASKDTDTVEVTTGAATIGLTAENNSVTNIRPTTFSKTAADNGTDKNIVKMTLTVDGESDVAGAYTITMNEPVINIGSEADQGSVSDIKYSVYKDGSDTALIDAASFTGTVKETDIASNVAFAAGDVDAVYYVYVWVDNNDKEQNNLQNVSFKLTFLADVETTAANQ